MHGQTNSRDLDRCYGDIKSRFYNFDYFILINETIGFGGFGIRKLELIGSNRIFYPICKYLSQLESFEKEYDYRWKFRNEDDSEEYFDVRNVDEDGDFLALVGDSWKGDGSAEYISSMLFIQNYGLLVHQHRLLSGKIHRIFVNRHKHIDKKKLYKFEDSIQLLEDRGLYDFFDVYVIFKVDDSISDIYETRKYQIFWSNERKEKLEDFGDVLRSNIIKVKDYHYKVFALKEKNERGDFFSSKEKAMKASHGKGEYCESLGSAGMLYMKQNRKNLSNPYTFGDTWSLIPSLSPSSITFDIDDDTILMNRYIPGAKNLLVDVSPPDISKDNVIGSANEVIEKLMNVKNDGELSDAGYLVFGCFMVCSCIFSCIGFILCPTVYFSIGPGSERLIIFLTLSLVSLCVITFTCCLPLLAVSVIDQIQFTRRIWYFFYQVRGGWRGKEFEEKEDGGEEERSGEIIVCELEEEEGEEKTVHFSEEILEKMGSRVTLTLLYRMLTKCCGVFGLLGCCCGAMFLLISIVLAFGETDKDEVGWIVVGVGVSMFVLLCCCPCVISLCVLVAADGALRNPLDINANTTSGEERKNEEDESTDNDDDDDDLSEEISENNDEIHEGKRDYVSLLGSIGISKYKTSNEILRKFGIVETENNIPNLPKHGESEAVYLFWLKKYDQAIELFERLLSENVDDDDDVECNKYISYCFRGMIFFLKGKHRKAVNDFNLALDKERKILPTYVCKNLEYEILCQRARAFSEMKSFTRSILDCESAIALKPKRAEAYGLRGMFRMLKKDKFNLTKLQKELCLKDLNRSILLSGENFLDFYYRGILRSFTRDDYEIAIADFKRSIRLNSKFSEAYLRRGVLYDELQKLKKAKKDYEKVLELDDRNFHCKCFLALILAKLSSKSSTSPEEKGDYVNRCEVLLKEAFDLSVDDPIVHEYRMNASSYYDSTISLEEHQKSTEHRLNEYKRGKIHDMRFVSEDFLDEIVEFKSKNNIHSDIRELENQVKKEEERVDYLPPFLEDKLRDVELEEEKVEMLKKEFSTLKFSDLIFYKHLGCGSVGVAFLCNVKKSGRDDFVGSTYVAKFIKNLDIGDSKKLKLLERDSLSIPYHRNVVSILNKGKVEVIDSSSFENDELIKVWEDYLGEGVTEFDNGFVIMKCFKKDLAQLTKKRKEKSVTKKNSSYLSSVEICRIMEGILKGSFHLFENKIVHRDLHPGNIFVDEINGRVWIGDFGYSLDLRDSETGFRVRKDEEVMYSASFSFSSLTESMFNVGGNTNYLPPEIVNFDPSGDCEFIDYSRSDIFSCGVNGRYLLQYFEKGEEYDLINDILSLLTSDSLKENPKEVGNCYKVAIGRFKKLKDSLLLREEDETVDPKEEEEEEIEEEGED